MSMNAKDRQAIEQIFARLEEVARHSPPRDPEADRFIEQQMASRPGSAYYMAQSIVALEEALKSANQQLDEVKARSSEGSLMPRRPTRYEDEAAMGAAGGPFRMLALPALIPPLLRKDRALVSWRAPSRRP